MPKKTGFRKATHPHREIRQRLAAQRQAARDSRTDEEQLQLLAQRRGESRRERERLLNRKNQARPVLVEFLFKITDGKHSRAELQRLLNCGGIRVDNVRADATTEPPKKWNIIRVGKREYTP